MRPMWLASVRSSASALLLALLLRGPPDPSLVRRRTGPVTPYDVLVSLTARDRGYPLDATADGTVTLRATAPNSVP
jgi:hypothetical protein